MELSRREFIGGSLVFLVSKMVLASEEPKKKYKEINLELPLYDADSISDEIENWKNFSELKREEEIQKELKWFSEKSGIDVYSIVNGTGFVYFTSPWCGPCKGFNVLFEEFAEEFGDKVPIIKFSDTCTEEAFFINCGLAEGTPSLMRFFNGERDCAKLGYSFKNHDQIKAKIYSSAQELVDRLKD